MLLFIILNVWLLIYYKSFFFCLLCVLIYLVRCVFSLFFLCLFFLFLTQTQPVPNGSIELENEKTVSQEQQQQPVQQQQQSQPPQQDVQQVIIDKQVSVQIF